MCGGASAGGGAAASAVGPSSHCTQPAAHLLHAPSARQEVWWGAQQRGCTGDTHLSYPFIYWVRLLNITIIITTILNVQLIIVANITIGLYVSIKVRIAACKLHCLTCPLS